MEPEVAGQIRVASPMHTIQIPIFYVGKKYAVGAILAHELSHVFLYYKGIWFQDPNENEPFTDLATVFIGLGKLLVNGLYVVTGECIGEEYRLGYLPPELITYCYERVNQSRAISRQVALMNLTPEARSRF